MRTSNRDVAQIPGIMSIEDMYRCLNIDPDIMYKCALEMR